MLSVVLYALLATGGNAAEIRRRQQELTLAAPRVVVQAGGTQPQGQGAPMQGQVSPPSGLSQPQGTYFTRPSAPWPSGPPMQNQNLVIPAASSPGAAGASGSVTPEDTTMPPPAEGDTTTPSGDMGTPDDNTITPGGTGRDLTNTPPALLGPNDTPGPNSWADVLPNVTPDMDDHTPTDGVGGTVSEEVQTSTGEAVNGLTEDQRDNLLNTTSTEEFVAATPDFQELVLVAAQETLADSEAKAEAIVETTGGQPQPITSLDSETYVEIQDIGTDMTEKSAELSKTLRELIDVGLDELRNNSTLDATADGSVTDANGNPVPPMKKRWISAVISALGLILEASKLADEVLDGGIALWKKFKSA